MYAHVLRRVDRDQLREEMRSLLQDPQPPTTEASRPTEMVRPSAMSNRAVARAQLIEKAGKGRKRPEKAGA